MKMASEALNGIIGIEIYPILSLIIFFSFFIAMGVYALTRSKNEMREMEHYVLDENDRWERDLDQPVGTDNKIETR
ncbi:MAG: hypothetical protein RIS47_1251 [Bacteroidota bacterium]|jgi:cbb3-type cytochrome oxidase subunit 3